MLLTIPVYIVYIIILAYVMFIHRYNGVKSGEIKRSHFKDYQGELPYKVQIVGNHYNNQFQIPVLFFITVLAIVALNQVTILSIVLAYGFIGLRLLHTNIHLGSNNPLKRARVYFLGILVILVMWIDLMIKMSKFL